MSGKFNYRNLFAAVLVIAGLTLVACSQPGGMELRGTVEAIRANALVVDGKTVTLPEGFKIDESLSVGDTVVVTGSQDDDGNMTASSLRIEDRRDDNSNNQNNSNDDNSNNQNNENRSRSDNSNNQNNSNDDDRNSNNQNNQNNQNNENNQNNSNDDDDRDDDNDNDDDDDDDDN